MGAGALGELRRGATEDRQGQSPSKVTCLECWKRQRQTSWRSGKWSLLGTYPLAQAWAPYGPGAGSGPEQGAGFAIEFTAINPIAYTQMILYPYYCTLSALRVESIPLPPLPPKLLQCCF